MKKTCSAVKPQPAEPVRLKRSVSRKPTRQPPPQQPTLDHILENRPTPPLAPEPVKSFEEMRRERLRERVQLRSQRIQKLFLQAF